MVFFSFFFFGGWGADGDRQRKGRAHTHTHMYTHTEGSKSHREECGSVSQQTGGRISTMKTLEVGGWERKALEKHRLTG